MRRGLLATLVLALILPASASAAGYASLGGDTGRNRYFGRAGNDVISARNGVRETVSCGTGKDRAVVDAADHVLGCERVSRR